MKEEGMETVFDYNITEEEWKSISPFPFDKNAMIKAYKKCYDYALCDLARYFYYVRNNKEKAQQYITKINKNNSYSYFDEKNIAFYPYYKDKETNNVWWCDVWNQVGTFLFTFDKRKIYNLFADYPQALTKEEKVIFDKENPYWAKYFTPLKHKI